MDAKIIDLASTDPYANIAREYSYYENFNPDEMVFLLWQNEPCAVMGRNQNIYRELNLKYIYEHNILPVRRFTGGGCVYHDLGNLNFTFIASQKNKRLDTWVDIILSALRREGIEAEVQGRNDILVHGKKVSGMAWLEDEERFLIHGTLMVDLDLLQFSKCLTPDISKFVGKGIKSVRSRVTNLNEVNPSITIAGLKRSLIDSFQESYPEAKLTEHVEYPDEADIERMIRSSAWIVGKREKAQVQRSITLEGKPLQLAISIDADTISDITIYTDSLDLKRVETLRANLIGKNYTDLLKRNLL